MLFDLRPVHFASGVELEAVRDVPDGDDVELLHLFKDWVDLAVVQEEVDLLIAADLSA